METHAGRVANNQFVMEKDWLHSRRPFYKVYPGIIPHLRKLKIDKVPTESVRLPLSPLAFRFAEGDESFAFEWQGKTYRLRTLLAGEYEEAAVDINVAMSRNPKVPEGTPMRRTLTLWMDWGERERDALCGADAPVMLFRKLLLDPGLTCEEAAAAWQLNLVEQHSFPKRHAQTIASISLNKNLVRLVIKGLAKLDTPTSEVELLQMVTDILAENELTTVNKLKQFIADPVDRVAKLLEAIAKLDADERESFNVGYLELTGGDAE